jgi:hypothetical protein
VQKREKAIYWSGHDKNKDKEPTYETSAKQGERYLKADHGENHYKEPNLLFPYPCGPELRTRQSGKNKDHEPELPLPEHEAGLHQHVFRKCEAGRMLPDAGHDENEDKNPKLLFW